MWVLYWQSGAGHRDRKETMFLYSQTFSKKQWWCFYFLRPFQKTSEQFFSHIAKKQWSSLNDDLFIFSELFKRHRNNLSIIYFPTCFCSCPVQCSHVIHIAKKQACEVRTMTTWYIGRGSKYIRLKYIHNTYTLKGRTFEGQIKPFEDPLKPFGFLRTV